MYSRQDILFPVVGVAVCMTCCVHLFQQLEKEKIDQRIGKVLFVIGGLCCAYVSYREASFIPVCELPMKLIMLFAAIGCVIVTFSVLEE